MLSLIRRLLVLALLAIAGVAQAQQGLQTFERSKLEIETPSGRHTFDIELALSPKQQEQEIGRAHV